MKFPYKIIDLTHALTSTIPTWNGSCGFEHHIKRDYKDCDTEVKFRVQQLKMHAGIGTHMDSPAHIIKGGKTIEQLDLNNLIAPCYVIDVSDKANDSFSVSENDIIEFEKKHGSIKKNSFVIIHTGWSQYWEEPSKYHNGHLFPSVDGQAAKLLLKRNIAGLGIDTLSPDRPKDGFPVHQHLLGNDKYIVENIANAQLLPAVGSYTLALPIKASGATEAPIRLIGLLTLK